MLQLPARAGARVESGELSGLPGGIADGIQTVRPVKLAWRIYVKTLGTGARVAIAQRTAVRNEVARAGALRALFPLLLLIPMLLLLVRMLVRRMFSPLTALARELDNRPEDDTQAIADAQVPTEIRPFVKAINRLLARVAMAMAQQRRFVADAAHELRSPLTALSLQAERLANADMSPQARERLASLRSGIRRSQSLVTQMLMLARVQQGGDTPAQPVSMQKVLRGAIEDLFPLAEARQIDLGVDGSGDAWVQATEVDLTILVKNLLDNAIRHTPAHGDRPVRIPERRPGGTARQRHRPRYCRRPKRPGIRGLLTGSRRTRTVALAWACPSSVPSPAVSMPASILPTPTSLRAVASRYR